MAWISRLLPSLVYKTNSTRQINRIYLLIEAFPPTHSPSIKISYWAKAEFRNFCCEEVLFPDLGIENTRKQMAEPHDKEGVSMYSVT